MQCDICENKFEKNILFQNDKIIILFSPNPNSQGHLQIYPKQHYTIVEEVPSETLGYLSSVSNKISMLLFEALKVHGTNILIQNGGAAGQTIPHFCINVIPRRSDDGMKIDWDLKRASNEDLDSVHNILSEKIESADTKSNQEQKKPTAHATSTTPPSTPIIKEAEYTDVEQIKQEDNEDPNSDEPKLVNYYIKSLERIP